MPTAAVLLLACLTGMVPVYLQLSGVRPGHRLLNNCCIGAAFYLSPQWSEMAHDESSIVMVLGLLCGELFGAMLRERLLAMLRAGPPPTGSAAQGVGSEDLSVDPVLLTFDNLDSEELYSSIMFVRSERLHVQFCCMSLALLITGCLALNAVVSALVLAVVYGALLLARWHVGHWNDVQQARHAFSAWWSSSSVLACGGLVLTAVRSDPCMDEQMDEVWIGPARPPESAFGRSCLWMFVGVCATHQRLLCLPPIHRLAYRVEVALAATLVNFNPTKGSLCTGAIGQAALGLSMLAFGELLGVCAPASFYR